MKPHPIFVARHPQTGEFYASQDQASLILRIDHSTRTSTQLPIPAEHRATRSAYWPGRTGLGHPARHLPPIRAPASSDVSTATVPSPGSTSAPPRSARPGYSTSPSSHSRPTGHRARLGSSIISPNVLDVIIRVTFDDGYPRILGKEVAVLPSQLCKAHRLLPLHTSVLVQRRISPSGVLVSQAQGAQPAEGGGFRRPTGWPVTSPDEPRQPSAQRELLPVRPPPGGTKAQLTGHTGGN